MDEKVFEAAAIVGMKNPTSQTILNPKMIFGSFDFTTRAVDETERRKIQQSLGILVKNILNHNSINPNLKIDLKSGIGFKGCRSCSCVGFRFNTSVTPCSVCKGKGKRLDRLKHEVICLDCDGSGKKKRFSYNNTDVCPDCKGLGSRKEKDTFGSPLSEAFERAGKLK